MVSGLGLLGLAAVAGAGGAISDADLASVELPADVREALAAYTGFVERLAPLVAEGRGHARRLCRVLPRCSLVEAAAVIRLVEDQEAALNARFAAGEEGSG